MKIILKAPKEEYYKHLLAITFTNRAVKEMKERIVSNLISFSAPSILKDPSIMILKITKETELSALNSVSFVILRIIIEGSFKIDGAEKEIRLETILSFISFTALLVKVIAKRCL